jgi:MinD superfamily P-loop ATPase
MKKTFGALLLIALIIVSCKSISGIAFKIDEDNCISCGECMNVCHHNAIVYDGDKPVIIQSKCVGCGDCVSVCPKSAIK